jgi:hypothetical protein
MQSMKSIIEGISDEFENDRCDINLAAYDIAIEADETVTSVDDNINKENFAIKLKEQAEKLIKTLQGIIEKNFLKLLNGIRKVLQTDKGFEKDCRKAIIDNKPLEGVKLITYTYDDAVLETDMTNLFHAIQKRLDNLKTDYTSESDPNTAGDMDRDENDLFQEIFKDMNLPENVTNTNAYFMYIKDKFRKNKKETLFVASQSKKYYDIAMGFSDVEKTINEKQTLMKNQTGTIRANLKSIIDNKLTPNNVKTRAVKQYKNAAHLYNLYTHFLNVYVQLKLEEALTYRAVMKKLFHF